VEGGISNGEPVVVRAAMKPIPTQSRPLRTVSIGTWRKAAAHRERSDVCAVPACSVVVEAMVGIVLADAFLEKFGGDSMREIQYNYAGYLRRIGAR
jgi:chorismate synthase